MSQVPSVEEAFFFNKKYNGSYAFKITTNIQYFSAEAVLVSCFAIKNLKYLSYQFLYKLFLMTA